MKKLLVWILGISLLVGIFLYWRHTSDYEKRGMEAAQALDYDRAIELFTKLIDKDPSQPEGYYYRGACYRGRYQFDLALRDAQWFIDKDRPVGYSLRGRVYLAQRRYDEALADFDKVMAVSKPLDIDHVDRLYVHLGRREFDRAREEADAALRLDPKSDIVYLALGGISTAQRDYKQALEYDNKAIQLNPDFWTHGCRAADYIELKEEALAIADIEKAKLLCPRSSYPWRLRSLIHLDRKEYDLALQTVNRAIELEPWSPDGYLARGRLRYYRKEYAQSLEDYDECIRRDPKNADAHANRVWSLMKLKEYDRAAQAAEQAIQIDSRSPSGFDALAWLWATCPDEKHRDGKKAMEYATKACAMTFENDPFYLTTLAAACAEAGDFAAARQWQQKGMDAPGSVPLEEQERNAGTTQAIHGGQAIPG